MKRTFDPREMAAKVEALVAQHAASPANSMYAAHDILASVLDAYGYFELWEEYEALYELDAARIAALFARVAELEAENAAWEAKL